MFELVQIGQNFPKLVKTRLQIDLDLFISEMQENKMTLFKVISVMPLGNIV